MKNKFTKKMFREFLNMESANSPKHKHNRFHQLKRGYGDYLYSQDRDKFNVDYEEWKIQKNHYDIHFT